MVPNGKHYQSWAARCRYNGLEQFYLGTVVTEGRDTKEHEVLPKFHELWKRISPHPFPDFCTIVPGMVVFIPDEN